MKKSLKTCAWEGVRRSLHSGSCRRAAVVLLACFYLMQSGAVYPQTGTSAEYKEYEVKVTWLFQLLTYVEWPAHALPPENSALTIGVLGENPFGDALSFLAEKNVKGRRIVIKQLSNASDGDDCQLIFIGASEKERLPQILESLKRTAVLTVGEIPGFAKRGGIVNLDWKGTRIELEINHAVAQRSGFTISPQLLKKARLVDT